MNTIQVILQVVVIVIFFALTAISGIKHELNNAGLNLLLALFYIILYFHPFK
jgi:hypothetical protein